MIAELFRSQAARFPDKVALRVYDLTVTYSRLADYVRSAEYWLTTAGVKPGQRVAFEMANDCTSIAAMLAASSIGCALVPVRPNLNQETRQTLLKATQAHYHFQTLNLDRDSAPTPRTGDPDTPYLITTTSGSTGNPKPAVITQRQKMRRIQALIDAFEITEADTILAATPLYHSLAQRLALLALTVGGTLILAQRFQPAAWKRLLAQATFTIAVPTQIQTLTPEDCAALTGLRHLVSSSAPLRIGTIAELQKPLMGRLSECYGTTEIAVATLNRHPSTSNPSMGFPLPGVRIEVIDENDEPLPRFKIGEIVVNTPCRFQGYFDVCRVTSAAFWRQDYFRTGDLGFIDLAGRLHFMGRKHDRIKVGGATVDLKDVDQVMSEHPNVLETAAFPIPDPDLGEVVGLAVNPRITLNAKSLRAWAVDRLTDEQVPRHYLSVTQIPKTETGKVQRNALYQLWKEREE